MDFFSFVILAIVILLLCVAMIFAYSQQARRLHDIQAQLSKIEDSKPELLRQERAQWLDPLVLLEVQLNQTSNPKIDEAMLQQIQAAREAIKNLNERLVVAREWMGPPFDLEWAEYLDRMPTLKRLYLAADFASEEAPVTSAQIIKE
jgi:predicted Holliday junction resolvase-like endonuclease